MVYHTELVRPYAGPNSEPSPPNAKLAARDIFVEGLREIEVAWRGGIFAAAEPDDPDRFGPGAREDARVLLAPAAARLAEEEQGGAGAEADEEAVGRWVEEQFRWLQAQQTLSVLEAGGGGGGGGGGKKGGGGAGAGAAAGGGTSLAAVSAALEAAEAPRRRKRAEKGRKVKKLRALEKIRRWVMVASGLVVCL